METQQITDSCLQEAAKTLQMSLTPVANQPPPPPNPLAGLPRFVPKPKKISVDELRASQPESPPPDRLSNLEAQVQALLQALAMQQSLSPPPSTSQATSPPPLPPVQPGQLRLHMPDDPLPPEPPQGLTAQDVAELTGIREAMEAEVAAPKKKGRPPGTGKHQIAERLAAERAAAISTPVSGRPLVSGTLSTLTDDGSTVKLGTHIVGPTVPEALFKQTLKNLENRDNWKTFKDFFHRLGIWKMSTLPETFSDSLRAAMRAILLDRQFVMASLSHGLRIEPHLADDKAYVWVVFMAGIRAWLGGFGA